MNEFQLDVARQRHRKSIDVDLVDVESLRLEIHLVPLPVGEAHDLVLERRAIPGTNPLDLTVEQRTLPDVPLNEIANAIIGVNQPAADLVAQRPCRVERERYWNLIASLLRKRALVHTRVEVDTLSIEPRRCSGLQSAHVEAK